MEPLVTRKERILMSAIAILDEAGVQQLSIRELAKRENISEAAIYRHFKNKQEIILEVLAYYCRYDRSIFQTIINRRMNGADGIRFFTLNLVEICEHQPAMIVLYSTFETLEDQSDEAQRAKEIFNSRMGFIQALVHRGQEDGSINSQLDEESLVEIIHGTFRTIILKWRIEGYNFSLKQSVIRTLDVFLNLIGNR